MDLQDKRGKRWATMAVATACWATACWATACGGTTVVPGQDASTGDASDVSDVSDGGGASGDGGAGGVPLACAADKPCAAGKPCIDGVCAPLPGGNDQTALRDPLKGHSASAEPVALECVGKSLADQLQGLPAGGKAVLWGRVDRFGGGGVTANVEIAVFRAAEFHPEACAGIDDPEQAQACFRDPNKVGKPLATTVALDPAATEAAGLTRQSTHSAEQECDQGVHLQCPPGYVCDKVDGWVKCAKSHGVYAIPDVPLHEPLILRARAVQANDPNGWHDSYTWNVVLFAAHLDAKGAEHQPAGYVGKDTIRYNPTIVGEGQWQLVPSTIGIVGGIYEGDGVIGGRVRDCGTATRRAWPVVDAKVGFAVQPEGLSYFNDSDLDPVPAKSRTTTNVIGRYAAVGVPPGPNRVAVSGRIAGEVKSLGSADVYVIPNALVIVSLPGLVPHWNK